MTGLYLQGGGAKGAFQAGVLCALNDRGVKFNVISGTSIGGINGYFVLKNDFSALKDAWLNKKVQLESIDLFSPIIESSGALEMLSDVKNNPDCPWVDHFFVNYVPIVGRRLTHSWSDLCPLDEEQRFERLRHSSLLPKGKGIDPFDGSYSLSEAEEQFKVDLHKGVYDEHVLDGGLLNNQFLEPYSEVEVTKLVIIVFKTTFEVPDYIRTIYRPEQLIVIASDIQYEKTDVMNFSSDFIKKNYHRGYKMGVEVTI